MFIPDPVPDFFLSRNQGSKNNRIPDPRHCLNVEVRCPKVRYVCDQTSVPDPEYFGMDPDPRMSVYESGPYPGAKTVE
jgi:hypothetical protein